MKTVAIVGLGYVGLPLLCLCVEKGLSVIGIDIDKNKLEKIGKGISPIDDPYLKKKMPSLKQVPLVSKPAEALKGVEVVIVCVPTPVDEKYHPDLTALKKACEDIASSMEENALVIIESTIFPATTEEIVLPILKKSGKSFFLAHCPERIDPGNKKYILGNLPRVVAGIDSKSTSKTVEFYKRIIDAPITALSSVKAAEATKIMENTFRDVNIAFVNEMAKSFDKAGIDILEVIKGASTKPFAFLPHYPGAGVGGHCIGVDPYYLIASAKQLGFDHKFVSLAREINNSMPAYVIELLENELSKQGKKLEEVVVGIMGLAYKGGVDDIRESPSLKIIANLKGRTSVEVFDPYVPSQSTTKDVVELLEKADCIILATDHQEFKDLDSLLKDKKIIALVDGKNCLDKERIASMGIAYHGVGRS